MSSQTDQAKTCPKARIVCFGEVLLRLASPGHELLFQQPQLVPSFCGAEANSAVGLAGFGHHCRMVTCLPDNPIGHAARRSLSGFGIDVVAPLRSDARLGLYFLQPGAMTRPSSVIYDRKNSAFAMSEAQDYDWSGLLEGADWLLVSGITAALGEGPLDALRTAMEIARSKGVQVAFDTNYRPTLWQGREAQAATILRDLSALADVLFAGRRATAMMVGGSFDGADPDQAFHQAAQAMFDFAPNINVMAATRREVASTDRQDMTALVANREGLAVSKTHRLENIVDRVGTGDAFAASVVHGLCAGFPLDRIASFAAACSVWAHSIPGDLIRATLADIEGQETGGGDVRR